MKPVCPPYMAKIVGQEDYVYIWTLGMEGVGDGEDKLVTVDVNPDSESYAQVVHSISMGGRHEAHHSGLTDDRRYLWASGLDTSKIFIFDVHTDPGKPRLHRTIDDFVATTDGIVGPHTNYAPPPAACSLLAYPIIATTAVALAWRSTPTQETLSPASGCRQMIIYKGAIKSGNYADGYGYDARALPRRNALVTSSFTGWNNYMMNLGKMMGDAEAMKRFGNYRRDLGFACSNPPRRFSMSPAPPSKFVAPGVRSRTTALPPRH